MRLTTSAANINFLAVAVAMSLSAAHARAQQPTNLTTWSVKGGLLKISDESIVFEQKKRDPITIRTISVTSVCYDTAVHSRGPSAWQATKEMGTGDAHGLVFAPLVLPAVVGVHASKSTRHLVTLNWKPEQPEANGPSLPGLTVEAAKNNYLGLLRELQQVTGKPWTDVNQRRNELLSHIAGQRKRAQRGKDGAFDLIVRQRSMVGNSILDSYIYSAVLQNSGTGEAQLYVFEGVKKDLQLAALIHVFVKNEENAVSEITPSYAAMADQGTYKGLPVATEIRMPTQTLEITPSQPYDFDLECPVLP